MENIDNNEQKYLDEIIKIIDEKTKESEDTYEIRIKNVRELSKYHWETKSEMDYIEKAVTRNDANHSAELTNSELDTFRRLVNARPNPFFGRLEVDFYDSKDVIHIGLASILEKELYDWRSPVSELYYKSRYGKTSYTAPAGKIECDLLNRQQIKIKNDKIVRIVDTDIHLTDEELQAVLSKNSGGKMKNIVTTIQEEQNEIIRDTKDSRIVVQGCAGSGKTSVALHRLSYLLYNDKKSTSNNMLIFSPSDVFSSYISNVLPDLGEENVLQTTFSDFANVYISGFDKIESFIEFLSRHYDGPITEKEKRINKFKFSNEYKKALDKFIQNFVNSYRFKEDFSFEYFTIPASYLNKILDNDNNHSLQYKIDMIVDEIYSLLKGKSNIKKTTLRNLVIKELVKPAFDPKATYNKFLMSDEFKEVCQEEVQTVNKRMLEYPDLIGMLYLNFEFMGYPKNNSINHLVVDEVQDYSPLQLKMISKMFNGATITVLGDANQTVNPYHKYESLEEMREELGYTTKYKELNKAYRSSPEIMNYVKEILDDKKIEAVREETGNPVTIKEVDKKELFTTLVKDIKALKENGYERICVVTKSSKESNSIFEGLKETECAVSVLCDDEEQKNLLVAPSYNAKGLEFDAVICYNDYDNSYTEEERCLYYVACTRAQHDLVIYNEPKELKKRR